MPIILIKKKKNPVIDFAPVEPFYKNLNKKKLLENLNNKFLNFFNKDKGIGLGRGQDLVAIMLNVEFLNIIKFAKQMLADKDFVN